MSNLTTDLQGWTDSPNGRGTFDIIWSSFLTIFLCTWTCLHLNVPAPDEGTWPPFLRKLRWMILTIIGPEFVVVIAAGQRANARRTTDAIRALGHTQWTPRHSFYANMGGFVLQPRDSTPFPINGMQLVYLLEKGYLTLLIITEDEISDKSKANLMAKILVCLQTGWYEIQRSGLNLTTLEVATISYVWCTWGIYYQWLRKPLDVSTPTKLQIQASTAEILLEAGPEALEPYRQTPLDFVQDPQYSWTLDVQPVFHFRVDPKKRPLPRILNDSFPWYDRAHDIFIVTGIILFFGGIHMFGWNLVFPTAIEKLLWRISALLVLCTTAVVVLWDFVRGVFHAAYLLHINKQPMRLMSIYYVHTDKIDKIAGSNGLPIWNEKFVADVLIYWYVRSIAPVVILYVLSRLYISSEALASLRALPKGAFQDIQWTSFILHY